MVLDPIETLPFCWTEVDKVLIASIGLTILTTIVSIVVTVYRAARRDARWRADMLRTRADFLKLSDEPKDLPPVTDGRYR